MLWRQRLDIMGWTEPRSRRQGWQFSTSYTARDSGACTWKATGDSATGGGADPVPRRKHRHRVRGGGQ